MPDWKSALAEYFEAWRQLQTEQHRLKTAA
jgi:hypothetical protein